MITYYNYAHMHRVHAMQRHSKRPLAAAGSNAVMPGTKVQPKTSTKVHSISSNQKAVAMPEALNQKEA